MQDRSIKKGFTVIELVVTFAILLIVLGMVFSGVSSLLRVRTAYDQEMILQQNFRYAVDRITSDLRQGSKPQDATYDIIQKPQDNENTGNAMGEELIFTYYDGTTKWVIGYKMRNTTNGSAIYRAKRQYVSLPTEVLPLQDADYTEPVTDYMKQLIKLYFVRQGGKVVVIMVGSLNYFGKQNTISYTSLIYSRNSNEQTP
jgi:type II secretory pathway pseudopilin PulG|uniref:Prepilin-type N-terminal cleavage/methylation domain-containing protein n=1 Tax=Caldisericum exile TaxID=693075 RepID=A0A7C4U0T7_9BACT